MRFRMLLLWERRPLLTSCQAQWPWPARRQLLVVVVQPGRELEGGGTHQFSQHDLLDGGISQRGKGVCIAAAHQLTSQCNSFYILSLFMSSVRKSVRKARTRLTSTGARPEELSVYTSCTSSTRSRLSRSTICCSLRKRWRASSPYRPSKKRTTSRSCLSSSKAPNCVKRLDTTACSMPLATKEATRSPICPALSRSSFSLPSRMQVSHRSSRAQMN
mmetsp:Transcript_653/g.1698  ORF Transcript_653/g.1698 Transcript_653/m.1698 type:complete len:217 (+) Transcript_653:995-1645(+)